LKNGGSTAAKGKGADSKHPSELEGKGECCTSPLSGSYSTRVLSTIVVKKDFQDSLAGHRNVRENTYTKVDRGMKLLGRNNQIPDSRDQQSTEGVPGILHHVVDELCS
jgi:hypothetical protein